MDMYYLTTLTSQRNYTPNFADQVEALYSTGFIPDTAKHNREFRHSFTHELDHAPVMIPRVFATQTQLNVWQDRLRTISEQAALFKREHPDPEDWYTTFYIPKSSGGMRRIDAPCDELKDIQRELVKSLSCRPGELYPFVHAHDAAYAYVPHRSSIDALLMHQKNDSHWFLKLDIKNFFPSCTPAIVKTLLKQVSPFHLIDLDLLDVCFWNGALPQGAVTSPFLTNMMMVPIDMAINKLMYNWNRRRFIYTRYADDILLSCREDFKWNEVQDAIQEILNQYGFCLKHEKTRYGSRAGSNWNLGIMLNKDNNLTLGHKEKDRMRASLNNFFRDFTKESRWGIHDTQVLTGKLNYMKNIEPDYTQQMLTKYETKYGLKYSLCLKTILNPT